ncbi:MAG: sterol desaturase family protein [Myxococcota bacterium]
MSYKVVVALIFVAFALVELGAGRLFDMARTTKKDIIVELGSGLCLPAFVVPGVTLASAGLIEMLVPGSAGRLSHWPVWLMFLTMLVVDDLGQYLWHRLTHSVPWLFELHRAHHSGEYMSVRVVYRNNVLYYAFMPNLWASGMLLYLGFDQIYFAYYISKMAVITSAHSSVPWDEPLLKIRWLRPLMWVVVRVISTPSTHSAHHGMHADDGVTHYKGNYGNFLFLWDVLFGTAKITGRRPKEFGLENIAPVTWQQELLWPWLGRSSRS